MPSGIWRGNCTASWSGRGSALGGDEAESSLATVSSTRCSNPSHALSGLWVRSSQLTRSASVWPSCRDRKSTRLNSSHSQISYAVFCLKKKKDITLSHVVMRQLLMVHVHTPCDTTSRDDT